MQNQNTSKNEMDAWAALLALARFLRSPHGCPWDRERSARDFAGFLQEEAAELIEALETGDNAHVAEEVGDCLFTLLAGVAAAEEEGRFRFEDALRGIHEKMIRRHGHVFADEKAETPQQAVDAWNRVKAQEQRDKAGPR